MIRKERLRLTIVLVALGLLSIVCANFEGTGSSDPITAMISEFSGRVQVLKASEGQFRPATTDTQLEASDQVLTGEDGRARIDISDGTIVRLSPLSNFVLTSIETTDQGTLTRLQLNIGRLWIILNGGVVEVDTPSGLASVRGSYLHVWVDPLTEETLITCLEGECALANEMGALSLVAGQTAKIAGAGKAPEPGKMTHEDVREWLDANPEATLVVVPLTATVAAGEDQPLPEVKTNTPTPTNTLGPSPTPEPSKTPTKTLVDVDCGPPLGWVLHTVREGESLTTLSLLYRVSEADLRKANCRGEMSFVVAGEKLYVPNVATSTPTKTPTPTPTSTPVSTIGGGGGGATSTVTGTPPTPTPTNSPTNFSSPVGPDNKVIDTISMCPNSYRITATDADGIQDVKMIYTFDGSLPMRDTAISKGLYLLLPNVSGDLYSVTGHVINTVGKTVPVEIRFRFTVLDKAGNVSYFPKSDAYDLTDKVNCNDDVPTTYSNEAGPDGDTITDVHSCAKTFSIDIVEPNGISHAKLLYSTDGSDPTYSVSVSAGDYFNLTNTGGNTWEATGFVETTSTPPVTVKFVYSVKDGKGNVTHWPASGSYSYTDTINCGPTTWITPVSPDGLALDNSTYLCDQTYEVAVEDADGIAEVKVFYTIKDFATTVPDKSTNFLLAQVGTDSLSDTYSTVTSIDLSTDGFAASSTVDFEFRAKDTVGNWTVLFSGQYQDDYVCGP